eukprot:5017429-Lingulodinium_polyedra.AAC.1
MSQKTPPLPCVVHLPPGTVARNPSTPRRPHSACASSRKVCGWAACGHKSLLRAAANMLL